MNTLFHGLIYFILVNFTSISDSDWYYRGYHARCPPPPARPNPLGHGLARGAGPRNQAAVSRAGGAGGMGAGVYARPSLFIIFLMKWHKNECALVVF